LLISVKINIIKVIGLTVHFKMGENYTTSSRSWSPDPDAVNGQIQMIKGLTGFLACLMIGIAAIIMKYLKINVKKILKSNDLEEGVLAEITKLQERLEMLTYVQRQIMPDYVQRQRNTTSLPDFFDKYDPRICSFCGPEDECSHDVVDGIKCNQNIATSQKDVLAEDNANFQDY